MEIRAGTGGDEAALFARDLYEMYRRHAEQKGWKVEVMESSPSELGGFKEVSLAFEGEGVYRELGYESGGHRVQRVPETEAKGRVHTSAATVAVMPEPEDVEVDLKPEDYRKDVFCASGPGGQHVNKTASAIRLTHFGTGIVVSMQDERSQQRSVVGLNQRDSAIDAWAWIRQVQRWLPIVDALYGGSTYLPMADGALFGVGMGPSGPVAKPLNERARRAVEQWQ